MKKFRAIAVAAMLGTSLFAASSAMAMPPNHPGEEYICIPVPFSGDWICIQWPFW